uniref:Uncharacterized protein n=1 Tax=Pristionchus pacificus TaxID=54126 RepID=A0A8R1Z0W7_PRIPA
SRNLGSFIISQSQTNYDYCEKTSCHPPLITPRLAFMLSPDSSIDLLAASETLSHLNQHGCSAVIRRGRRPATGQFVFPLERIIAKYAPSSLNLSSIPPLPPLPAYSDIENNFLAPISQGTLHHHHEALSCQHAEKSKCRMCMTKLAGICCVFFVFILIGAIWLAIKMNK